MPRPEKPLPMIAMSISCSIPVLPLGFTTVTYGNVTREAKLKHGNCSHKDDGGRPARADPRRDEGDRRVGRVSRGVDRPGGARGRGHAAGRLHAFPGSRWATSRAG